VGNFTTVLVDTQDINRFSNFFTLRNDTLKNLRKKNGPKTSSVYKHEQYLRVAVNVKDGYISFRFFVILEMLLNFLDCLIGGISRDK
jgi:hypothetical protein